MTDVTTSEVEKLLAELDEYLKGCPDPNQVRPKWLVTKPSRLLWACRDQLAAIQQDKDRAGVADGMLHDALEPFATQWYSLCERAPYATRITITGELAEAIVKAVCAPRPAQPAEVTDAMVERAAIAIHDEFRRGSCRGRWDMQFTDYKNRVRNQARAVLTAALRLPDEQENK